ncbi:dihydroxyacetone kinase subunit DhaL [uncultured Schumannella sp.]|uniref:dihydroxyacetone kinase subunit DhaL n=1 Tax=uncultured Schumannella sp. TaxID=1195956 RepID=UPI0025FC0463|nr:dihydroxyacetone kinase subunit DhaL [uncultured Schumannella sp.]
MTNSTVPLTQLVAWLETYRTQVTEQRAYLTELDSAIGDADHGANMARGFAAVMAKLEEGTPATADELFKSVGMTLVTSVGGASGPLYGTFFLRMGMTAGAVTEFDGAALAAALRAGLDGIVARGKAELGDKTMFDALAPALDAFDGAVADGKSPAEAAAAAADAAEKGRDATEPLVARKGRASYLGERSAGHLDPGAASSALLLRCLAETLES